MSRSTHFTLFIRMSQIQLLLKNTSENVTINCRHASLEKCYQVLNKYQGNKLFEALLKNDFTTYLGKSNVGNAQKIFKITTLEGILTAYKLFYVGCSRARKNLVIVVDKTKINKFENEFKAKLISTGFEIQGFPMQEPPTV